jgi:hypothetical protein
MRIIKHLTKRGRIVLIYTPLAVALLWALVWVSANVWYVPGQGYCIGSLADCFH